MSIRTATYTRTAFFEDIIRQLRTELPPELSQFQVRNYSYLIKLFYDNERVHFEVWVDSIRSQIEIGLDFEDGADSTAAYLAFFDQRIVEIKERTGPTLELERWTKTWGHFVEVYPIEPFEPETARVIGERMVGLSCRPCNRLSTKRRFQRGIGRHRPVVSGGGARVDNLQCAGRTGVVQDIRALLVSKRSAPAGHGAPALRPFDRVFQNSLVGVGRRREGRAPQHAAAARDTEDFVALVDDLTAAEGRARPASDIPPLER